ncbi:aminotransferase class I/II-fold pyridoxal phosphate-dependent enzyme [Roseibium sp.]|uniref:aminotransferase class I/II-fold pyridoxal phosphate-dependent enzyme n=1 Tax=Roseibium sp. TaxID=1936156 RepID=UPI0039EFCEE7
MIRLSKQEHLRDGNVPATRTDGFLRNVPVCRPQVPTFANYEKYLNAIDQSGWYTNFGPLNEQLERRLASHFNLERGNVCLTSSGTAALVAALRAVCLPGKKACLMPSWTFVATAAAAVSVGLEPHFCDVDLDTWMPCPTAVENRSDLHKFSAIIIVAPFAAPVDTDRWHRVQQSTGIPVIIDAAAAFDSVSINGPMSAGPLPIVLSMHATKTFAVGEAGVLLSGNKSLIDRSRAAVNFGFHGSREAQLLGFNGKLSEIAAAVGHATLDTWPETRRAWLTALQNYLDVIPAEMLKHFWIPGKGAYCLSTFNCRLPSVEKLKAAKAQLARQGVSTRRWWGGGCHNQFAYSNFSADPLPVTERVASTVLGLPIWQGLTTVETLLIVNTLSEVLDA